jgi:hypothetical protein
VPLATSNPAAAQFGILDLSMTVIGLQAQIKQPKRLRGVRVQQPVLLKTFESCGRGQLRFSVDKH